MKRYLFLGILSLLSIGCYAGKIRTGVKIGELSKKCDGSGFCYASTTVAPSSSVIEAYWVLSTDGRQLTMTISDAEADKLPPDVYDDFSHGRFNVGEPFAFPSDLNSALESFDDIVLPVRTNTVTHAGGIYTVVFTL